MDDLRIRLLRKQKEKGLTGFTIAYLIGACRIPIGKVSDNTGKDYQDFIELLEFFQHLDDVPNCYIGISECVKLKQPVVALYSSLKQIAEYELEMITSNNSYSTLYASSQYHKKATLNSVVEILWRLSEQHISVGYFSFENGQYSKFTEEDIKFIKAVSKKLMKN